MATPRPALDAHVLVVEDEPAQREVLIYNLEADGYRVSRAATGAEAMEVVGTDPPDLVLLDWMIPDGSGIEICRRIRARAETAPIPVIIVSARAEEGDRVRGLDTGADDYVVKPYSLAELKARITAVLRRARPAAAGVQLRHADIVLEPDTRRVSRAGRPLHLGPTEFRLLAVMLERPGRVWSREQLLDRAWGRDAEIDSRTVDVHVGRLRKALRQDGGSDPLRTVRGMGYAMADADGDL
ncbi:MAG: phosphate regulon transcriptional regulator PhoB [Paracoccaceae bacterium]